MTQTQAFGLASPKHILRLIATDMYTNPIEAIVREIACNAADSHQRAGTDRPFKVNLPTKMDGTFAIRDYGVGMTPEVIRELYTTIGGSDKRVNEETGFNGIGSKSPFAYTQQFSVESVVDGTKWCWHVHRFEDGNEKETPGVTPACDPIETDEPDGVRVTFHVAQDDVRKFQAAAQNVLRWFEDPFECNVNLDLELPDWRLQGDDWAVRNSTWRDPSYVIMGNVAYEWDPRHYHDKAPAGLCLWVPIGSVVTPPNREKVKDSEASRQYLRSRVDELLDSAKSTCNQAVADKTPWQARAALQDIDTAILINYKTQINGVDVRPRSPTFSGRVFHDGKEVGCTIDPQKYERPLVVWEDANYYKLVKAKKLSHQGPVILCQKDKDLRMACRYFDIEIPDMVISEVEIPAHKKPKSSSGGLTDKGKADILAFQPQRSNKNRNYWRCIDGRPTYAHYVIIKRYKWQFDATKDGYFRDPSSLQSEYLSDLEELGLTPRVVGVKPRAKDDIPDTWTCLKEAIDAFFGRPEIEEAIRQAKLRGSIETIRCLHGVETDDADINRYQSLKNGHVKHLIRRHFPGSPNPTDKEAKKAEDTVARIKRKYPLVEDIRNYADADRVEHYINGVACEESD